MTRIISGVADFQQHVFGAKHELFERLRDGQHPLALFITCSDSRIDPNLLTQTEPGELFVLRNAGNLVPSADWATGGEAATIEYAVAHLRVRDMILCGHSRCGAMSGLLAPTSVAPYPLLAHWLELARESVDRARALSPHAEGHTLLELVVEQNVLVQIEHLQTYPAVRDAVREGRLRLHGWRYEFDSGQVHAFDATSGAFVPLPASSQKLLVPALDGSLLPGSSAAWEI